ncbi:MAG: acylphosphatase [candidate division KSB1 bacterium]|nr:acylphosphatase [candidate division KSB1 bacterium]
MEVCAHIIVEGMVQGVGFRYFVYRSAKQLNLRGFVRNLPNGKVEVEVEGERGLVEELIKELKVGPRYADVQDLKIMWKEYQNKYQSFEVRYY